GRVADFDDGEAVAGPVIVAPRAGRAVPVLADDVCVRSGNCDVRRIEEGVRGHGLAYDLRRGRVRDVDDGESAGVIPGGVRVRAGDGDCVGARQACRVRGRPGCHG